MDMLELVNTVAASSPDAVRYQFLHDCMTGNVSQKKGVTRITFETKCLTCNDVLLNTGRIGVILWLDREQVTAAQSQPTPA